MKLSRSIIAPLLLLALIFSGYSIFWYVHASQIENELISRLDKQPAIQYDAIVKSGFPTSIDLTIKNPKFAVDLQFDGLEDKSLSGSLDGDISARFGVFGGMKGLHYIGKTNLIIPDETKSKTKLQFDADLFVKNESEFLLSKEALKPSKTEESYNPWLDLNLESASCVITNFIMMQPDTDKVLTSFDKLSLAIQNKAETEEQNSFEIESEIAGMHYGDISPLLNELYTGQGKTNSNLNVRISLPSRKALKAFFENPIKAFFASKTPPISIELKALDSSNNYGFAHASGALAIQEDDEMNASITSRFSLQTKQTKSYYDALVALAQGIGENASTITPQTDLQKTLLNIVSENSDLVTALIPQIDQFGVIEFSKDLKFEFNKNKLHTTFALNKLLLTSELYGMNLHGLLEGAPYNGTCTLDLYNYKKLIVDAIDYYNRATKLLNNCVTTPVNTLSNDLKDTIVKTFLQISDAPENLEAKDISITLRYENGQITIGTLPLSAFILETAAVVNEVMSHARPIESMQGSSQGHSLPFLPTQQQ